MVDKKILFYYFLFFLAAFAVCLFVRFPGEKTAAYFTRTLMQPDSTLRMSIGNVKPALPFRFQFEHTQFHLGSDMVIKPEPFFVSLGLQSLFKADKIIDIRSQFNQGKIKADLHLKSITPFVVSSAKIFATDIKMNAFNYVTNLGDLTLNGEMSGDIKFHPAEEKKIKGEGTVSSRKFSAEMKNSFFNTLNIPVVDFSDIQFDFTYQGNVVTINQGVAKGPIIHIVLKGTFEVLSPFAESRLDLSGSIMPDSPYLAKFAHTTVVKEAAKDIARDGIRFNITGTFKNPEIGI